jgi:hypothetical protein
MAASGAAWPPIGNLNKSCAACLINHCANSPADTRATLVVTRKTHEDRQRNACPEFESRYLAAPLFSDAQGFETRRAVMTFGVPLIQYLSIRVA